VHELNRFTTAAAAAAARPAPASPVTTPADESRDRRHDDRQSLDDEPLLSNLAASFCRTEPRQYTYCTLDLHYQTHTRLTALFRDCPG